MSTRSKQPYTPAWMRASQLDAHPVQMNYQDANLADTNSRDSGSFKYDPLSYPLKNTQQLNVDWSKFENHTFFSSAEVKVNEAFNNIINSFPFDGSKKEVESFLEKINGFEKWVFDNFPTWSGALQFSGTKIGEDPSNGYLSKLGTWISVKDKTGFLYPELSKNSLGDPVITPDPDKSFTIEAQIFLPTIANDSQVILQKISSESDGFSLYLEPTISTTYATASLCISSGSFRNNVTAILNKGSYNHICATINKENSTSQNYLQFYVNEALTSQSNKSVDIKKLNIDAADLLIGSGSSFYSMGNLVVPSQTLSGTLDELRIFHSARNESQQRTNATRGLYSTPELKLYYRFNEPPPPLSLFSPNDPVNAVVLDSSGNSLHSTIMNFTGSLRDNATLDSLNPVKNERQEFKKILFPASPSIMKLNETLLATAKSYDAANPNIILKLIPQHYLLEGASQDGFESIEGNSGDAYGGSGIPGQGQKGSAQIILSFLYIWAKFFDDIKLFIDAFGTLRTVDYDTIDTVPDNFLEDIVRSYGFYIPPFFNHSTIAQYSEAEDIDGYTTSSDENLPLKKLQALILRRILVNVPQVIRSKGTQHSIRTFLRSVGIDPDNSLKIREYGGSTTKSLTNSREKKMESGAMIDFIGSSLVSTPYLSSSRIEPGFPVPAGSFYHDSLGNNLGTTNISDGLLTSGSWTAEALYKFPKQNLNNIIDTSGNQSLFRMLVTGSSLNSHPGLLVNVIATQKKKGIPAQIKAYARPGMSSASPVLSMSLDLPGLGVFDGDKWNISFGHKRSDEIGLDYLSSSYCLRAGKSEWGDLVFIDQTETFFNEQALSEGNAFRTISSTLNASGAFVSIGRNQQINSSAGYSFLNDTTTVSNNIARTSDFEGWASNFRFWSKFVDDEEWKEHVRNYKSTGASDPFKEYNFVKNISGSFNKLRIDSLSKQIDRNADSLGNISFVDYSQHNMFLSGTGFVTGSEVVIGDMFSYGYLSPAFDEASTDDKIRIRSFEDPVLINENPWASSVPSYAHRSAFAQEEPVDDVRLSIEFSLADALDRDIINMFSSFDVIGNAIGNPDLMFSPDYPDLEKLRDVYFNRLSEKMNFRKFLEFYRWFDGSISSFIEQIVPSKTKYKGTNFVIESHILERHKTEYRHSENYMGDKQVINDSLLVQQIVGSLKKY